MAQPDARSRLVEAAFELFAEQGFEQTTVDQIAARAGVGRTTFFRLFASKEAVLFPDHDKLVAAVDARLASASSAAWTIALIEGTTIVLNHYLDEGELARKRYQLTRSVPALRAAETAGLRRYHRLYLQHALRWGHDPVTADLLGAGVVAAHNHVLRRWLLEATDAPHAELAKAITQATRVAGNDDDRGTSQVIVLDTPLAAEQVVAALRELQAQR